MVSEERAVPSRIQSVLHRMSDAFVSLDDTWTITYLNDRGQNVLGRGSDELVGRSIWEAFPTAVDTPFYDRCVAAMDNRTRERFETEFTPIDARLSVQIYPHEDGLSIYFQDVSLRRRREEELTRYTTVVEAVSDGVLVVSDTADITMVNEAVEGLFDTNRGHLIGRQLTDLPSVTQLTPDDAARIGSAVDDVLDDGAEERTIQIDVPGENGQRRVAELKLVPLPGTPEESVVGVIRDVTEREEHKRIVTSLHEATRRLFQTEDPADICATAVHTGADLLDLQISGIFLLDEERNRLEPIAATSGAHDMFGGLPTFSENQGIVWEVFRQGDGVYFDNITEEEGIYNPETPIRSELIVPIGDRGVLMAGDIHPGMFDETHLELAEILAAHTDVALDRAQREQLLGDRADQLDRQDDRIDAVTRLLTGPIGDTLDAAAETATGETLDRIEQIRQYIDDACYVAGGCEDGGPRAGLVLSDVVDDAVDTIDADLSLEHSGDARFRARPEHALRLLVAAFRVATRQSDTSVEIGVIEDDGRIDGFYLEDNVPPLPPADRRPPFGPTDSEGRIGIELAVARRIVTAHGWSFDIQPTTRGMKLVIEDVTTIEPVEESPDDGHTG